MGNIVDINNNTSPNGKIIDINVVSNKTIVDKSDKYDKLYVVFYKVNTRLIVRFITIKIIGGDVLIYSSDNNTTNLIHVAKFKYGIYKDIDTINKLIKVSPNFELITLPEKDGIFVYDLKKLLLEEILEHTGSIVIDKKTMQNLSDSVCMLFDENFVIVNINVATSVVYSISLFNHKKNTYNQILLNVPINKSIVRFTPSGNMCSLDTYGNDTFVTYKINVDDGYCKQSINKCNPTDRILNISDNDCKFVLFIDESTDTKLLNTTKTSNDHNIDVIINQHKNGDKYCIIDYTDLSNINLNYEDEGKKIYVIVKWNVTLLYIFYWIVKCDDTKSNTIIGPININIGKTENAEYVQCNGSFFVYKTSNRLIVHDIKLEISVKFTELMGLYTRDIILRTVNGYINDHDDIYMKIKCTDDSCVKYLVPSLLCDVLGINGTIIYEANVPTEIYMYREVKSFDIFAGLMSLYIDPDLVLNGLFLLKTPDGIHVMMYKLVEHILEYAKMIISGDTELKKLRYMFVGYVTMNIILKYYIRVLNMSYVFNRNIIQIFLVGFPVFGDFMNKIIESIFGKS